MQETVKDRIKQFLDERNPPQGKTINTMMHPSVVSYEENCPHLTLSFPVQAWQLNGLGNLHGGMIATALDTSMGCIPFLYHTGHEGPTIQMSINFVTGITAGDELLVEVFGDHLGQRVTQSRCVATSRKTGKIVATAHASFLSKQPAQKGSD